MVSLVVSLESRYTLSANGTPASMSSMSVMVISVTTAMQVAGTSYRGFYAVLERLRQAGIIATDKDEQDQRVRRLSLHPSAPMAPANI